MSSRSDRQDRQQFNLRNHMGEEQQSGAVTRDRTMVSRSMRDLSPDKWSDTLDLSSSDESSSGDRQVLLTNQNTFIVNTIQQVRINKRPKNLSQLNSTSSVQSPCSHCHNRSVNGFKSNNLASNPLPERWKLGIAVLYGLFVSWLTAVVMTVVHDRWVVDIIFLTF